MLANAESRLTNTPEAWSERARTAETPLEAVMWSERGQLERFGAVLDALDPTPEDTFLDFGCGTGALAEHLWSDSYIGYDWAIGMTDRATREHPEYTFLNTLPWQRFDMIACIGTFNLSSYTGADSWRVFNDTYRTVHSLWERCDKALAVSLYQGDAKGCVPYDTLDVTSRVEEWAQNGKWRVEKIRYNDLLAVMWR